MKTELSNKNSILGSSSRFYRDLRLSRRFRQLEAKSRSVETKLTLNLARLEDRLNELQASQVGLNELHSLLGQLRHTPGSAEINDLEELAIRVLDLAYNQLGGERRITAQSAGSTEAHSTPWEAIYYLARQQLADLGLRPEFPEGEFDRSLAQPVEAASATCEDDHYHVKEIVRPAIVSCTGDGPRVLRPAAVVVWKWTPEEGEDSRSGREALARKAEEDRHD